MFLYIGTSILTVIAVGLFQKISAQENQKLQTQQNLILEKNDVAGVSMFSLFKKYSYLKFFLTASVLLSS